MKAFISIIILCLVYQFSFAQKELAITDWSVGQTKRIYNHNIQKTTGNYASDNITNLSYQSAKEMIEKIKEEAKIKNWQKSKLDTKLDEYRVYNKGGLIQLFVLRKQLEMANTSNFTVYVIKDGQELQKKTLTASPGKSDGTTNFVAQNFSWIKNEITPPFEIHVEEKTSGSSIWHKFLVVD